MHVHKCVSPLLPTLTFGHDGGEFEVDEGAVQHVANGVALGASLLLLADQQATLQARKLMRQAEGYVASGGIKGKDNEETCRQMDGWV